jgi:hypothetical protein
MLSHNKGPYEARPRVGLIPIKPAAKGFILRKTLRHFFPPWNKKKKIGGFYKKNGMLAKHGNFEYGLH